MRVYQFLILYVATTTVCPAILYFRHHSAFSTAHIALTFFLNLNFLICLWEISLGFNITKIAVDCQSLTKKYEKRKLDAVIDLMMHKLTLAESLSLKFWSRIWSTYSLYDPSYSNRESFGFFIDVGNGWTTIIPTVLFLHSITYHDGGLFDARVMGMIGLVKFYQEFYGTCIYFLSFFMNKRHAGKSFLEVFLFVGVSNGIWFFFPLLGMYISVEMIKSNSFNVLI